MGTAPTMPTTSRTSTVSLRNGVTVVVRPMLPTDERRLQRFHASLSPETTRYRFFTFHPELSPTELYRFTHVDHRDREAIVAVDGDHIVAVARWDRDGATDTAEVAFVVTDAWQGIGLGGKLLRELATRARVAGLKTLTAETLPDNYRMLAVFRHSFDRATTRFATGVVEVEIPLD